MKNAQALAQIHHSTGLTITAVYADPDQQAEYDAERAQLRRLDGHR
jgi:hypothetical protein